MKSLSNILTTTLLGGAFILTPMAANSQPPQGQPQNPPAAQAPAKAEISDEKMGMFVEAFGEVRKLEQDFTRQLEGAENQEEAQALQQRAQQKMMGAVEDAGLSVAQYNEIVSAMRQDPELRQQILEQTQ